MRTSLTILTLLAAAGTAVAAPTPHADRHHGEHHGKHGSGGGAIQKIVSGNHRRSDSRVVVDMTEHATDPNSKGYKMTEHNIKASKHAIKASEQKVENRRSRRAVVSLFPDQDPGSKAGVADAKMDKMNAHVIQTPGKDQTIVDVQSGKMDGKVNLPKEVPAPVKEMTDNTKVNTNGNGTGGNNQPQNVGDDIFGGIGQSLSGKGGPPGAEVSYGDNQQQQQQQPSKAPASAPSPKPTPSSAPKSSVTPKPAPASSSASAARAPPRSSSSSSSAAPKSAAPAQSKPARPSSSPSPKPQSAPAKSSPAAQAAPAKASPSPQPQPLVHLEAGNPAVSNDQTISNSKEPLIDLDVANPAILSGLSKKPVIALGKPGSKSNTKAMPSKVKFGKMPKNTIPCDGLQVRDSEEMVELCMRVEMLDQRPKNTHACPEYNQHGVHAHYDDNSEMSKVVSDYVRLCMGAGAV